MDLEDKVVIITGASRGIGRSIAVEAGKEKAKTVLAARSEEELKQTKEEVEEAGGKAIVQKTDVTNSDDMKELFEITEDEYDRIDVVINNAGVSERKHLVNHTEEEYDKIIDVNLKGVFLSCKETAERTENATIINVASGAGRKGYRGMSVYCASKFGVIGLTESFAGEYNGKVFAVCPGPTDTQMYRSMFPRDDYSNISTPKEVAQNIIEVVNNSQIHSSGSSIDV